MKDGPRQLITGFPLPSVGPKLWTLGLLTGLCALSWLFSGEHAFLLEFIWLSSKPHPVALRRGMFPLDTYFINRALSPKVTKNFQKKGDGYKSR